MNFNVTCPLFEFLVILNLKSGTIHDFTQKYVCIVIDEIYISARHNKRFNALRNN